MVKVRFYKTVPFITSLVCVALLISISDPASFGWERLVSGAAFAILVVFTATFRAPLRGGFVSLMPMVTLAGYLVLGLATSGWVAFLSSFIHGLIRDRFLTLPEEKRVHQIYGVINLAAANSTVQTLSILTAGIAFQAIGGTTPLSNFDIPLITSWVVLGATYLAVSYLLSGFFSATRGLGNLREYLRAVPLMIFYEGAPLIFSPYMAFLYTQYGLTAYFFMVLAIYASTLITRDLAISRAFLERELAERESLESLSQLFSSTLDLDAILMGVYRQVVKIMPAECFYVGLYDAESEEISFPLVIENEARVHWPSRYGGRGLTETVLKTRRPLLGRERTDLLRQRIDLDEGVREASSWLGVPLQAGDELLGVIAVQSFSASNLYDMVHQKALLAIASQAAVAIKNAQLYANTDLALKRRVQEMDSILRTVSEGILLIDLANRVVAANRAMAELLGIERQELIGLPLLDTSSPNVQPILNRLGYSAESYLQACQELSGEDTEYLKELVAFEGLPPRQVERTHIPVHNRHRKITGWLLSYRDISVQIQLENFRQDMLHMLIHDLRSPLAVVQGSLSAASNALSETGHGQLLSIIKLAQRSNERILRLVNDLLDIGKIETGELLLNPTWIQLDGLLADVINQAQPTAENSSISLEVNIDGSIPPIYGDQDHLERVFINLVDNAVKFTPDGGRVSVWSRFEESDAPAVIIGIDDTGPGISEEAQAWIFEKFHQVNATRGRRSGTGLGLYYCKLVVEAHGGKIWVESQPGKGSTFAVRLPARSVLLGN